MIRILLSALVMLRGTLAVNNGEYEIVAHLTQKSLPALEKKFWEVANPESEHYLQHLSIGELASLIGASDDEIEETHKWMLHLGAEPASIRVSALRDMVTATFTSTKEGKLSSSESWSRLKSNSPKAVEFTLRRDPGVSNRLQGNTASKKNNNGLSSTAGPMVNDIKAAYSIPTDLEASNEKNLQMVWGPGTFGYDPDTLQMFKQYYCPKLNLDKVKFDTKNQGEEGGDNFDEGNLDVQMISSFGLNVQTLVSNTNTSSSTEEGSGFGQALLDFITELSSRDTVPQVLSMSLGSLSAASCDLLCSGVKGFTKEECKAYMETQRQVCMYLSQDQQKRINTAFQVLGLRGVSIFGSSGDGGSHFAFSAFPSYEPIGAALNEVSCQYQMPVFPTSSPYIVSVGGSMWNGDSSHPTTWSGYGYGSGSGFSWLHDMPDHQKSIAGAYLNNAKGLPPLSSFNQSGRAYPDLSAIASQGTSQSCPIIAGIFSMLNDKRMNAGLAPLGFVAPRIWKMAEKSRAEIFRDVPSGNSKNSCDNGFPSVKDGWDANTGFGEPNWPGLVKYFASDQIIQDKRMSSIIV